MIPLIVVPTFISGRRRSEGGSVISTYDHTTPLSQPGELPRLLDSLRRVEDVGVIAILVASEPGIENQAAEKVQDIADSFADLDTIVIAAPELALVQQRFDQLGLGKLSHEVGLSGYGAIRNLGLVVANTLGFDAVVFLDDDVVIEDPAFLHQAMYGLGKITKKGVPILAKTGYYLNSENTYLSLSQDKWYNRFWQKGSAFNEWIESAMRGPRLSRSNHVCGGCLALHKEAFKRLSFDPWIPRGEDLDYMLNLRMYGSDIWFDNAWKMRHLPPETANEGTRFRQDVYRWLYEYSKMEYSSTQIDLLRVKPASLEPYPGPFLEPGIVTRIRLTAFLRSIGCSDKKAYRKAARAAKNEASTYAQRNCSKYFEFQFVWPELMARIENDKILGAALVQSIAQRMNHVDGARRGAAPAAGGDSRSARQHDPRTSAAASASRPNIDPGMTCEIRLNVSE